MGLRSLLSRIMNAKSNEVISIKTVGYDDEARIAVQAYAIQVVVEILAALVSKCEIKTYRDGKSFRGEEWYLFNVKPNVNQTAVQFKNELVRKTLVRGESLVVSAGKQIICADSWSTQEYALYPNRFSQVARGSFTFQKTFDMGDVLYLTYSNGGVRQILTEMLDEHNRFLETASSTYVKSGGQKGILEITPLAQGQPDFEEKFDVLMNNYFKTYFDAKNAVLPLWGGMKYTSQTAGETKRTVSEATDYISMLNDALEKAAIAFNVSPAIVKGNVENISEALSMTLTSAVDPFAKMLSDEITAKRYTKEQVLRGCYAKVCTNNLKHLDVLEMANAVDKLIASGFYSTNELRENTGEQRIPEAWADKHTRTKNYETIEGGGNSNE